MKSLQMAVTYSEVITKYLVRNYIRKITPSEKQPMQNGIYIFAILKSDQSTTKTKVVLNASAKYNNISLNDMIHQGPNLQRKLFDMLWHFRQYPVAI